MKVKKINHVVKKLMVAALAVMVIGQRTEIYASTPKTASIIAYEDVKETGPQEVTDTDGNEMNTVVNKAESSTNTESNSAAEISTYTINNTETTEVYKAVFSYTICWDESTEYHGAEGELIERPADPNLEGYTFLGWYREPYSGTLWDFTNDVMPEGGITLYAHFIANPEPIRFYAGEYTDPASLPTDFIIDISPEINHDQILDLSTLPMPSLKEEYRDDFVFTGLWYATQEMGSEIGITSNGKISVPSGGLYITPVPVEISNLAVAELCASNIKFSVSEYLKYQQNGTLQDEILRKSEVMARIKENGGTGPVEISCGSSSESAGRWNTWYL